MLNIFKQDHPKGLYLLFFVEMWERFSYYGMRALIVLYMVQVLSYTAQTAGNIYGLYTGLVYLTPLFGGYLADRFFGQRKCITAGALLMSVGLFTLAFAPKNFFLFSLLLMILANGCFKSNISSVLGLLYENEKEKKDSAFTIFYMGINLGAFLSPLVCGTLAVKYGYEWGFAAAGFGMLIGLTLYKVYENKWLNDKGMRPVETNKIKLIEESGSVKKMGALIILMFFTIPFWICFEQAGSSLTLFAEYQTNRHLFGFEIPTGYFQSLNPLFIIIFAPLISAVWENMRLKSKEPDSVSKFSIALLLMTVAYVIMALAGFWAVYDKVSVIWLILVYFVMTISELFISPIGLSLVSKLAPRKFLSLTMGCWFLTSFFGNGIAGFLGGKYETVSHWKLFASFGLLSFVAFVALVLCFPYLKKVLSEDSVEMQNL